MCATGRFVGGIHERIVPAVGSLTHPILQMASGGNGTYALLLDPISEYCNPRSVAIESLRIGPCRCRLDEVDNGPRQTEQRVVRARQHRNERDRFLIRGGRVEGLYLALVDGDRDLIGVALRWHRAKLDKSANRVSHPDILPLRHVRRNGTFRVCGSGPAYVGWHLWPRGLRQR